ncbi:MAG: acetate--CoA ligase family protein [Rhodospirillaceae bacterium]|nr:acetate--CoA ligase family protein [Rhodospirillaceae bacterium]MDD9916125.1 acetate--CoA ligase family protein [Rhodospirillaceae bacterium]MDD9928595.1 acetate--CoA ligase family protein [Rhodospirillaceae bacterium]
MNFEEHAAKPLLAAAGIAVPESALAATPADAAAAAEKIGPCVVKAQVPTGKRGKAGGIKLAGSPAEAKAAAQQIIGMDIAGNTVEQVLVEAQADIAAEYYACVLTDAASKGPLMLFSTEGGMDIEEVADADPDKIVRLPIDIRSGMDRAATETALGGIGLGDKTGPVADVLEKLYGVYVNNDADLVEINPLIATGAGDIVALDCKFSLEDSGANRRPELVEKGAPEKLTELETRGRDLGLRYIELDGDVGVLANGAGLTMTTMDVVRHYGGEPANFLEIGGEAYTLGKPALELVLSNPNVKCLLVNFCGAFARTDVMTEGIVNAWQELKPTLPVFFTIHGTNEDEAIALVRDRLDMEPYDLMDDAVKAAVAAASGENP